VTCERGGWTKAAIRGFLASLVLGGLLGCDSTTSEVANRGPMQADTRGGLFESAVENLDRFEEFDTQDGLQQILKQTSDRLNQWFLQEKPKVAWEADPLLDKLDPELRNQPDLRMIETVRFLYPDDGWYLQEAVWLKNISAAARADQFADLEVARRLFDWTIRHIKLEADSSDRVRHRPHEVLLYGRGTALERAWVFILLARQQGLDVVYLGLEDKDGAVRPWLTALVEGENLYLFDTALGMPIPGPEPGSVATLAQVRADEKLLRKLDLDAEHPYPVTAADLEHVVAFVEASPTALSRRMALVESKLKGEDKLKLTSPGSDLAERVGKLPGITDVRLWPLPLEVYLAQARRTEKEKNAAAKEAVLFQSMPTLRMARALQFKAQYEGEKGAKSQYLSSRPPDDYIQNYQLPRETAKDYPRETVAKLEASTALLMRESKQAASFWLGLIFFDQGDYTNSIDFLVNRALNTQYKTPWADAARYNLARAYEAAGETDKAIELYSADKSSPQSHGNQLRGRWLKEQQAAKETPADETATAPAPEADRPAEEPEAKPAEESPQQEAEAESQTKAQPETESQADTDAKPAEEQAPD
jgi:hypothetical protein